MADPVLPVLPARVLAVPAALSRTGGLLALLMLSPLVIRKGTKRWSCLAQTVIPPKKSGPKPLLKTPVNQGGVQAEQYEYDPFYSV